ncbi:hypothetical protein [Adhaeribacter soli]|uniref:Uncharacterized protein n=1 Tax=Adhaeribacter soli TaxID=2607655 RepID=A0A5N1IS70_9BACT|nr:hypothetical protein [Adhaeribacter soli]KAA9331803.1 hypothetical protein F0P94_13440 [Adhaeribacter soli]
MAANLDQIGARFRFYMKIKELGIYEAGILSGTSATLISNIIAGKNYTMDELLKVLSEFKDLNSHWVIYGEGNLFKQTGHHGPIVPEKRMQHLQEMQRLLEKLDAIEKSKANQNQIEALKARIAALTTQL